LRARGLIAIGAAAFVALALGAAPASAGIFIPPTISQIFTSGGDPNQDVFENDFVELKNLTATPFGLAETSLQYATATGTTWAVTPLPGAIPADGYYLVGLASSGTDGEPLPTPDATGSSDLQLAGGKVALVGGTTALTGACPTSGVIELVGWGNANCYEGSGPEEAPSGEIWSLFRRDRGCTDTNDNDADFNQASPPAPRNTSSATYSCANDPPVLTPIGPQTVDEGVELSFTTFATDADSDQVTFSASNLPPGATFNGTQFSWTPTCRQAGTYPGVHFEARDPENASDSEDITITVDEACDPVDTTTTLKVAKKGKRKLLARGAVSPPQPGSEVEVRLLRKRHGAFRPKGEESAELTGGSGYEAKFKRPKKGKCRVVAEFPGSGNAEPSSATKTFRCRRP
jgi:hypothetical protein